MFRQTVNKPTVLLAEDDEQMGGLLRFLLEREGYEVLLAADGRQALNMINEMSPPRLVLLDVMLPYTSGMQLLVQIRANAGWRTVPIIMLSADSNEGNVVRALDAGADDYVTKPFRPKELLARIRRSLESRSEAEFVPGGLVAA